MSNETKKFLCPDCRKEISTEAESCPECGYPVEYHQLRKRVHAVEERERAETRKGQEDDEKKNRRKKLFGGAL